MKKPTLFALSALLLCFASSCQKPERDASARPEEDAKADIASIKALLVEWVNLYNAEDFEKLISIFYKKNAILMPPNAPARRTQEEILLSYRKDSESNIQQVDDSVAEDVRICGDLAFAWGQDTGTTTPRGRESRSSTV